MTASRALDAWTPAFEDTGTLGAAYAAMPGDDASVVPWYVSLLENPASPVALPGAVDLLGHDCIHIVLSRGTSTADEAFVLGMTMGSSARLHTWHSELFAWAARWLYRGPWRLTRSDLGLFRLGVAVARTHPMRPLGAQDWRIWWDTPLSQVRAALGVPTIYLRTLYTSVPALHQRRVSASQD
jgi:hypothetical protein